MTIENTAIVLDSTADLPNPRDRYPNSRVVPQRVLLGEVTYRDHLDLTADEFYRRVREDGVTPRTAQATPADFEAAFAELDGYERLVVLVLPQKLSGTYDSAVLAAEARSGAALVIDTGTVSGGTVLLADAIQRRLEQGTSEADLLRLVDRFRRDAGVLLCLATVEYLVRGGRVGRARGALAAVLDTKPILTLEDGEVVPVGRALGRASSLRTLRRLFTERSPDEGRLHVAIAHADAALEAEELAVRLGELRPQASLDLVCFLGPALGSHSGPGAIALFWFEDET
jgi:fatty acid kinase fatty acid binding subunit